jgi:tetratricopeptide (TPR) repeat protein
VAFLLLIVLMLISRAANAQSPKVFVPPVLKGERNIQAKAAAESAKDPASMYASRHEAAIAALKAANRAATGRSSDRAINLLILAARRDPAFSTPVYNLGILCERTERWADSLNFYREVARLQPDSELSKLASAEAERVQLMANLELTPAGKRQKEYNREFVNVLARRKDAAVALDLVDHLYKLDPARWEAPALSGLLLAQLGRYAESTKSLETASHLSVAERRQQISAAAETARKAAIFSQLRTEAEAKSEQRNYGEAGAAYAKAWEIDPGNTEIGMQAAVTYLMADDADSAAQVLARIRQIAPDGLAERATAMLEQLSIVSDQARLAVTVKRSPSDQVAYLSPADRIEKQLGELASAEIYLVAKEAPALAKDDTSFMEMPDPDLNVSDISFLSTESVFARYQQAVGPSLEAPPSAAAGAESTSNLSSAGTTTETTGAPLLQSDKPAKFERRPRPSATRP